MDLTGLSAREIKDDQEQETTSTLVQTKVIESSEWTDEKHSLYLNSIETTFVKQLYKSFRVFDQNTDSSVSKSSKNKQTGLCAHSGQFKVLRQGHWSKRNFKRDVSDNKQVEDSGILLKDSPWIRHYISSEGNSIRKYADSHGTTESVSKNVQSLQEGSASSINTEVMDQNFDDDLVEDEKVCDDS